MKRYSIFLLFAFCFLLFAGCGGEENSSSLPPVEGEEMRVVKITSPDPNIRILQGTQVRLVANLGILRGRDFPFSFEWKSSIDGILEGDYPSVTLSLGEHVITCSAFDEERELVGSDSITITVTSEDPDDPVEDPVILKGLDVSAPWPMFGHDPQGSRTNKLASAVATNNVAWEYSIESFQWSAIAISSDTIYAGTDYSLLALNKDGSKKWEYISGNLTRFSCPALSQDGRIYTAAVDYQTFAGYLLAISLEGKELWRSEIYQIYDEYSLDYPDSNMFVGPPLILEDGSIVATGWEEHCEGGNGITRFTHEGVEIWGWGTRNPSGFGCPVLSPDKSWVILTEHGFFTPPEKGNLRGIDINYTTGNGRCAKGAKYRANFTYQQPIIVGSEVIYSSTNSLAAYGADDDTWFQVSPKWTISAPVRNFISIGDQFLISRYDEVGLTAYTSDGTEKWSNPDAGNAFNMAVSASSQIFAVTPTGIVCFNASGTIWKYKIETEHGALAIDGGSVIAVVKDKVVCFK